MNRVKQTDPKKLSVTKQANKQRNLNLLHEARLDGKVTSKKGEEERLAKGWLARGGRVS